MLIIDALVFVETRFAFDLAHLGLILLVLFYSHLTGRPLFILEGDLVAYESQVLPQHSVEIPDFFSCEHSQLHYDQYQIQNAQDRLEKRVRSLGHAVVFP